MNDSQRQFLTELLDTPSPSGFESSGQRCWFEYVRQFADRVESDTYGTAWATRDGSAGADGPTVMLEAHADEIGFMVNHINDDGFIFVTRIGGSDRAIARGKAVRILGEEGPVTGIIGNTAIHLRETRTEKVPEWHKIFVDVGATSRDEVLSRGIQVGHPMVYADTTVELTPDRLTGRALDNRIGGYIIAQVMARLSEQDRPSASVYAVNSVQEEIGGHGAKMVAYRLHPTVAVILDVTHATDTPAVEKTKHGDVKLGGGPSVTFGSCNHPMVVRRLLDVAAEKEIKVQREASSLFTGTDTDDVFISRSGVPSALISLPMRYMHSTVETVTLRDVEQCIEVLVGFVTSIKAKDKFAVDV